MRGGEEGVVGDVVGRLRLGQEVVGGDAEGVLHGGGDLARGVALGDGELRRRGVGARSQQLDDRGVVAPGDDEVRAALEHGLGLGAADLGEEVALVGDEAVLGQYLGDDAGAGTVGDGDGHLGALRRELGLGLLLRGNEAGNNDEGDDAGNGNGQHHGNRSKGDAALPRTAARVAMAMRDGTLGRRSGTAGDAPARERGARGAGTCHGCGGALGTGGGGAGCGAVREVRAPVPGGAAVGSGHLALSDLSGVEPGLQEQPGRYRVHLAAHGTLGETLLFQDTLSLRG